MVNIHFKTELINPVDDVFVYVQEDGTWFKSNCGYIMGSNHKIQIDTLTSGRMMRDYMNKIKDKTKYDPDIVINTHHHNDHNGTNHLLPKSLKIAQKNYVMTMEYEMKNNILKTYKMLFPEIDFSETKYNFPDITFESKMEGDLGDFIAEIIYAGKSAHTNNDSFVYLKKRDIIFMGDLLFSEPCTPFALAGNVSNYIEILDRLSAYNVEYYIPGHGPIIKGPEPVYKAREYLVFVRDMAKEYAKKNMPLDDIINDLNLGNYKKWNDAERIVGNFLRAYGEYKGTDVDFSDSVKKMIKLREKYNKGDN